MNEAAGIAMALRRTLAALVVPLVLAVVTLMLAATGASASSTYSYDRHFINATTRHAVGSESLSSSASLAQEAPASTTAWVTSAVLSLQAVSVVAAETAGDTGASDPAESCSVNSFTGATPVLLANGTEIPISKVAVGDKVLATDPQTGQTGSRPVTGIIVHSGEHTMVDVTLADGSTLTATDHHPFWDATTATFTYADALHAGDQLREANGGLLTITNVVVFDENVTAYNLTVDGIHTYYAGTTPVLVHNSCGDTIDPNSVRFSQSSVSPNFSSGGTIFDLTEGLGNGTIDPADVPPIRLVEQGDDLASLDNRRLLAFQMAGVDVPYVMASPEEAAAEAWKFTSTNGGTSILVRGVGMWP